MNIYQKISAIMSEVKGLQKDTEVGYNGKMQYKAISENKVTKTLREQLIKHSLVVFPISQTYSRQGNITSVNVVYKMVNAENPEESIEISSSGEGSDTQDKGAGKAMTYAYKYMLLRTFAVPTGEDPDFIHSDTLTDMQNKTEAFQRSDAEDGKPTMATDKERKRIWAIALKKGIEKPGDWIQSMGCSYNYMTTEDYVKLAGALNGYESQSA